MSVPIAYMAIVFIWATTPLAIQWSNTSLTPVAAIGVRMGLAWLLIAAISKLFFHRSLAIGQHWRSYLAGSIGIFPAMLMVYNAAQFLPSALIAVFFAPSVFANALLANWILNERSMTAQRYLAVLVALAGLIVVTQGQLALDIQAWKGILLLLAAVFCYSLSSVLVKYYGARVTAAMQMEGSLLFSLPGLLFTWLLLDGGLTSELEARSTLAVLYLVVIATLLGFFLFYFLLQRVSAVTIGLVPLITPVLAIWIGSVLNGELVTPSLLWGSAMVVLGLALFNLSVLRGWLLGRRFARFTD